MPPRFLQGYNAQAVANEHQIVIAAEVMTVAPDFGHLEPMLDAKSRKGTRPRWDGGLYAFMRRVLASERGGELFGQRQAIIEPVFANRSSTAASTASDDEAEPRSARNGD
jgi:hypothetical protein